MDHRCASSKRPPLYNAKKWWHILRFSTEKATFASSWKQRMFLFFPVNCVLCNCANIIRRLLPTYSEPLHWTTPPCWRYTKCEEIEIEIWKFLYRVYQQTAYFDWLIIHKLRLEIASKPSNQVNASLQRCTVATLFLHQHGGGSYCKLMICMPNRKWLWSYDLMMILDSGLIIGPPCNPITSIIFFALGSKDYEGQKHEAKIKSRNG